ncbi:MAG: hypothetical protein AAF479_08235 [Pseudomonadota bacterium]
MFKPGQVMYARAAGKIHRRNCECCGVVLTPHQGLSSGICDKPTCHEWMIERVGQELIERKRKENAEKLEKAFTSAAPLVAKAAEEIGAEGEDYVRCKLPYQGNGVVPLTDDRKAEFEKHLRWITARAFTEEIPDRDLSYRDDLERDQHDVLDTACSACRGGCCATAGDGAFLQDEDIKRWRQRNPDGTDEEVVEEYLGMLPDNIIDEGCVFQGPEGCNMPRSARSDQCHTFYCKSLKTLQEELMESTHGRTIFVAEQDRIPVSVTGWSPSTGRVPVMGSVAPERKAPEPIVFSSEDFE